MTPTERKRIEKEADEYIKKSRWMESWKTTESKLAYIAGATTEHDKARNQAIDACKEILKNQTVDCSRVITVNDLLNEMEALKTNLT